MPPTTAFAATSATIDIRRSRVYLNDRPSPVVDGDLQPRLYEIALLCILRSVAAEPVTERYVTQLATGGLSRDRLRRTINELELLRVVRARLDSDELDAAVTPATRLQPSLGEVRYSLRLTQQRLGQTAAGVGAGARIAEHRIARAERAMLHDDYGSVFTTLIGTTRTASFLPALERSSSGPRRAVLCALARRLLANAAMSEGRAAEAIRHADLGLRWTRDATSPALAEERVRLFVVRGASFRMWAATSPTEATEHLASSIESFRVGLELARRDDAPLEPDTRNMLIRWIDASMSIPLILRGDYDVAEGWLNAAEQDLGAFHSNTAETAETYLLMTRRALAVGALSRAADYLARARAIAGTPGTAPWVRGWIPRYEVDLSMVTGASRSMLRNQLVRTLGANGPFGFQRLLAIARLASWGIEIAGSDADGDFVDGVRGDVVRLHRWLAPTRRHPRSCPTCSVAFRGGRLLPSMQCIVTDHRRTKAGPLAELGLWR